MFTANLNSGQTEQTYCLAAFQLRATELQILNSKNDGWSFAGKATACDDLA